MNLISNPGELVQEFTKIKLVCKEHPTEIANLIYHDNENQKANIICSLCMQSIIQKSPTSKSEIKSLKQQLHQLHQNYTKLTQSIQTCAFMDHYISQMKIVAKQKCSPQKQQLVVNSIDNFFEKYCKLLTGEYFEIFYQILNNLVRSHSDGKNQIEKLVKFMYQHSTFLEEIIVSEEQQKDTTQNIKTFIKIQLKEKLNEFIQLTKSKKQDQQQIFQLFSLGNQSINQRYKFSSTLLSHKITLTDQKKISMTDDPENEFTVMALVQPMLIGKKKKSIRFRMKRISGWVSVGIGYRKKIQANNYVFNSTGHGSYQISYDGYTWSNTTSSANEHYTGWYYNEGDTVEIIVDPSNTTVSFTKMGTNNITNNSTLTYQVDKSDKLYFIASVNYFEDQIQIVE